MKTILSALILTLLSLAAWADQPVTVQLRVSRNTAGQHTSVDQMRGFYADGTTVAVNKPDTTGPVDSAVVVLRRTENGKFHIIEYELSGTGKSTTEAPAREVMRTEAQLLKFAKDTHKEVSYGVLVGEPALFLSWKSKAPDGSEMVVKQGFLRKNTMWVYERSTLSMGGKVVSDVELAPTGVEWVEPPAKYRDEAEKKVERTPSERYAERTGKTPADCPTCALGPVRQADDRYEKFRVK